MVFDLAYHEARRQHVSPLKPGVPWPKVGASRYYDAGAGSGYVATIVGHAKRLPNNPRRGILYTWWQKGKYWLLIRVRHA